MAEEPALADIDEMEEGDFDYDEPPRRPPRILKPCNERIDKLATPYRRTFLSLYVNHGVRLTDDKLMNLETLLQQLYAMTPEESKMYFEAQQQKADQLAKLQRFKRQLRKFLKKDRRKRQRALGLRVCKRIIKRGLTYAASTPVPPLVSERLRILSDIILEHLVGICSARECNERCACDLPDRLNPGKIGHLFIAAADWMAILIERLFYLSQVTVDETVLQYGEANNTTINSFRSNKENKKKLELKPFAPSVDSKFLNMEPYEVPKSLMQPPPPRKDPMDNMKVIFGQPAATSTPRGSLASNTKDSFGMATTKAI